MFKHSRVASVLLLFIAFSFLMGNVSAVEITLPYVNWDDSKNSVSAGGVTPFGENAQVTILVKLDGQSEPFYFFGDSAGSDGSFEFTYLMDPEVDPSGTYIVHLGGAGLTDTTAEYLFINKEDSRQIISDMSNASSIAISDISDIALLCGIDFSEGYNALSNPTGQNSVCDALENRTYTVLGDIKRAFDLAVAIQTFNESNEGDGASLLARFADIIGFDITEDSNFASITALKDDVYSAITGQGFALKDPTEALTAFNKAVYTALFNEIDTSNREELWKYADECNRAGYTTIPLEKYSESLIGNVKRAKVMAKVIELKNANKFATIDDVKRAFEAADAAVLSVPTIIPDNNYPIVGTVSGYISGGSQESTVSPEVTSPAKPQTFNDLNGVEWAAESIEYLTKNNVLSGVGDGQFEPNRAITREEFVKLLVEALKVPPDETDRTFADVSENAWYYDYVMRAYASGLVNGVDYDNFGVGTPITREQLCTMIYRTMNLLNLKVETDKSIPNIADYDEISDYATDAVNSLYRANIVNGVSASEFAPKGVATRAMAAKIVYEVLRRSNGL
ncbi:MAG: S-layer homology domain-containing protein [Clostridia bacterium]|nr:S-layer homology domain-containing protein [Clostridia bacterium]